MTAEDADDRVDQLSALTEQLSERLTRETRAFEARRPQDAAPGLAETQRLANLYRHESARVRREPALIAAATPERRERLKRATLAFDAVLARHGRALEAARTVTEGLVRAVAEEVAAARPKAAGYGPGARPQGGAASAVTLNRRA
jgi:hypothetical protein